MREEFRRSELLLGPQALERLAGAHAAVFGVGGVGGHAAEALARAGVGSLTLFDSDTVALSNINRQIAATHATLGQYKVDVMGGAHPGHQPAGKSDLHARVLHCGGRAEIQPFRIRLHRGRHRHRSARRSS